MWCDDSGDGGDNAILRWMDEWMNKWNEYENRKKEHQLNVYVLARVQCAE